MKIAIIGCGAIAANRHAPAVFADPGSELYAVCDPVKENADALADKYKTRAVYDIDDIVKDPEVDAVIVCTPERFHCANVIAALEAGKDVLCEKPLAVSSEEGARIMEAWKKSGRRLMVAFAQRLNAEHRLARKLLRDGAIGRPIAFRTNLAHKGAEYAGLGEPAADFYDRKIAGIGDVMQSVGCHRVDLVPYLLGSPIKAVSAMTSTIDKKLADGRAIPAADHAMIHAELENGCVGTLWISWCDYGEMERGTVVYGTEGVMRMNAPSGVQIQYRDGHTESLAAEESENSWQEITHHFIAALNGKEDPVCDGQDGMDCLQVLDAIKRSAENECRVEVVQKGDNNGRVHP